MKAKWWEGRGRGRGGGGRRGGGREEGGESKVVGGKREGERREGGEERGGRGRGERVEERKERGSHNSLYSQLTFVLQWSTELFCQWER